MGESILKNKSFLFALHIVAAYKDLCCRQEYVMSKQLLRCGTSIGANIAEAERGQSVSDFTAKMYISLKEANETENFQPCVLSHHSSLITHHSA